jgi:hypothetical protein
MNEFKLDNHPKIDSGFVAPEHYFDTLSSKINAQLAKEEPKVISFYQRNKKTIFAVAAVMVIALCIPFFMQKTKTVSELDQNAIEDYISYNTKMTPYELAEYLDAEDIEKLKVDFEIQDDVLEESILNSINVEHYIVN